MMSLFNSPEIEDQGIVELYPSIITAPATLLNSILEQSRFHQNQIIMWGKVVDVPRLEAWHGDFPYTYSGILLRPQPWYPALAQLKSQVEELVGEKFNSCLINQYRDGQHYVNWHCDDEIELGTHPTIVSVSLGASRKFVVRKKCDHTHKKTFILKDGDVLVMKSEFQEHWEHSLPKMLKVKDMRINLTFRNIQGHV